MCEESFNSAINSIFNSFEFYLHSGKSQTVQGTYYCKVNNTKTDHTKRKAKNYRQTRNNKSDTYRELFMFAGLKMFTFWQKICFTLGSEKTFSNNLQCRTSVWSLSWVHICRIVGWFTLLVILFLITLVIRDKYLELSSANVSIDIAQGKTLWALDLWSLYHWLPCHRLFQTDLSVCAEH